MFGWIALGIFVYLIVGGIIAAIVDDEEMMVGLLLLWPLFIALIFLICIGGGALFLGSALVYCFKRMLGIQKGRRKK